MRDEDEQDEDGQDKDGIGLWRAIMRSAIGNSACNAICDSTRKIIEGGVVEDRIEEANVEEANVVKNRAVPSVRTVAIGRRAGGDNF